MPTEAKRQTVADLADRLGRSTIAIATDFTGLTVNEVTELRKRLREQGIEYRVVKNRLALLAADEAGQPLFRGMLEGSTAVAFGYEDVVAAAKILDGYIKETRSELKIRSGLMDGKLLTSAQLIALAALPPKNELVAKLLGQMNAPITGLATVLSGPVRALATVLQRRAEQLGTA